MNPAKVGCCRAAKVRSKVQPLVSAAVKEEKLGQWHFQWHWMKALIGSDYFKSTVDLRRHGSGVMKPPCVLPGFVHKYAHRSPQFSTYPNCAVSQPHPYTATNLMKPLRQKGKGAHFQAHLLELQPPGQCARAGTSAGQHTRRVTASRLQELKCLQPTSLLAPFLLYLLSPHHRYPSSPPLHGPLSSLFSIFLLFESFSFSLSAAATFSTNYPSFRHPFALQLPGSPPAASLPVLSYENH